MAFRRSCGPPLRQSAPRALRIVAVGAVAPPLVERAAAMAREVLWFAPTLVATPADPTPFLDATRGQYRADLMLVALRQAAAPGERVLGITALDLCLPVLTFVYGFAELRGVAAVVSAHRLDPRFVGARRDHGLMLERLEKEVLHELGHLSGLTHCADRHCVMASAHDVGEIDLEEPSYCPDCRSRLTED